jgi:hypothetical protein
MSYYKILLPIFLILVCFSSCNKYDANGNIIKDFEELKKAKWILGEWKKTDSIGTLEEKWKSENDSTYIGTSYFIKENGDTIHSEAIELQEFQEHLIYKATVKGENNNDAIPFLLMQSTDSLLVFENPKHDYPQKIMYKRNKDKSILATVSGKQQGKNTSEEYLMQLQK